ncbi:hypothetical protein QL285_086757 [Trifolium repens]|nr:hypothetical protein QL285_086757 [Trifolium repens]
MIEIKQYFKTFVAELFNLSYVGNHEPMSTALSTLICSSSYTDGFRAKNPVDGRNAFDMPLAQGIDAKQRPGDKKEKMIGCAMLNKREWRK